MKRIVRKVKSPGRRERELTVEEAADDDVDEEAPAGNTIAGMSTRCLLCVQRVQERSRDEVAGPNHRRWCDKKARAKATDREANQLGRHGQQPLVCVGK